ncbi:MAG: molybdopterin-dependent oxidoreductase, partial [Clostridia bacterium]|nr:molybdopterin-dependent oxidoreductase [Clostridia bacterium]
MERNRRYEVREWEMKPTSSVCPYCGVGCNVELYAKGRRVVKVKGRANPRVNGGWLCVKGRYGLEFIGSDSRLKKPLIRAGAKGAGKFREATWEEALDYVAENLGRLKKAYGPQSLAVVGSARCTNEDNYVLQKFARVVLGTNNIDHVAPLWYSAATRGLEASLGTGAMTNSLADMDDADCILLLGSGISKTCPVIGQKISHAVRYRGARLILIDQVASELAELAAIWLRPKPGTEVALINGLMNVIVTRGLSKSEFIARRTEGFKETENKLGRYTPEYVAGITGV